MLKALTAVQRNTSAIGNLAARNAATKRTAGAQMSLEDLVEAKQ
jgi:hypothetical protein